ncbi:NCS1 family nucleobase:cation symporter-1 [Alicyclobacillus mali (ex Roth et al. 2021)]|uniref:NCS1 family nucleobase:cation symporter-1 n=1 Tax=Alicyclobacillus mali (ex Roth et al. 2021) TaxID=1123961 RepID=UPI000B12B038|nr:NCS1 family nucleobase:cation symporter-1 [Alicyclobacillus mali (ex Roth et al. 2021)]
MAQPVESVTSFTQPYDPSLYNEDLAPVSPEKKTWSWVNFTTVWMGMVHNIVSYETAASLLGLGMSVSQAIFTVVVANAILILAMCLNSVAGAKYGLPFPVLARAAFGHRGAQIPVFFRAFVAIFWFSIQAYAGSEALSTVLGALIPGWNHLGAHHVIGMGLNMLIAVLAFWLLHAWIVSHGIERVRHFELWAGPLVIVLGLGLVGWALSVAHGFGPAFSEPSRLHGAKFWSVFGLTVTGLIGSWSTLVLNIPDFTRFARSQKDQVVGQAVGLPGTAILFSFMSIVITSGTLIAFGKAVIDPVQLIGHFHSPVVQVLGCLALVVATLSVNVAANLVSPAYDLVNMFPKRLNFVRAGLIAIVVGFLFAPWAWYDNAGVIFSVLNAIGGGLGPVAGIMMADFYLVRKRQYEVDAFYTADGGFRYRAGWNPKALVSLGAGLLASFIGLLAPSLSELYNYSWFLGLFVGGLCYAMLMTLGEDPVRHEDDWLVGDIE